MIYLSLIVPVYNERVRLRVGLSRIVTYLKKQSYSWELIVVDDGSDERFIDKHKLPITVIRLPENQGKGAAISAGVRRAKGKYIVFSDIDLSVPIERLRKVLDLLSGYNSRNHSNIPSKIPGIKTYDIIIASRRCPTSKILVHQSATRELSGRMFTLLSNILCNVGVSDATCGFKGFKKDVAKRLFAQSKIHRWVFDTEILFLARKFHYTISELPVSWKNQLGSRVRAGDMISSFFDLLKIRWYEWRGEYNN